MKPGIWLSDPPPALPGLGRSPCSSAPLLQSSPATEPPGRTDPIIGPLRSCNPRLSRHCFPVLPSRHGGFPDAVPPPSSVQWRAVPSQSCVPRPPYLHPRPTPAAPVGISPTCENSPVLEVQAHQRSPEVRLRLACSQWHPGLKCNFPFRMTGSHAVPPRSGHFRLSRGVHRTHACPASRVVTCGMYPPFADRVTPSLACVLPP
jgi:hypothetical protein